ncbi:MAG: T9SS type A sorting domain-containing protein [Candidatus Latescibacteria bacterium]|nr:T9SS type A sorting domain-containing protein [Candidatus Latescibacterota bacterium]
MRAGTVSEPKGAVGFFGTTNSTSGTGIGILRGTVVTGFFQSVFIEQTNKLGDICRRAKFLVDSIRPAGYNSTRYREWNLLGDPELNIWTAVPKQMTVIYDSVILTGSQIYNVHVHYQSNPVANALVCLMKGTTIYEYGYTNSAGTVSFSINPQALGIMSLTVSARNFHPVEKTVTIGNAGIEQSIDIQNKLFDLKVYPNPLKSFATIRFSVPVEARVLIQLYDVSGRAIHTLADENKMSGNYNLNFDAKKLLPGVYMMCLRVNRQELIRKIIKR